MHRERMDSSWTKKHGESFLMQAMRVSIHWRKKLGIPYWPEYQYEDLVNEPIYEKMVSVIGRPYCSKPEMFYACRKVPEKFICSSSAWWAIREAHGVDIAPGDFLTVFPADIMKSQYMRVVTQTF
jgi:hypothetical protein